jgi:hypothetical protein
VALDSFSGKVLWWAARPRIELEGGEGRVMIRRNIGTIVIAAVVMVILIVAFILARAQDKLPELGLDLLVYLFATTLAVFVIGRMLAWRESRRWTVAKDWLHMILLETIDDLLKELLPATVPRDGIETDEEVTVYQVAGERVHFGETVRQRPGTATVRGVGQGGSVRRPRAGKGYVGNFWPVTRSRHYGHGDEFRSGDRGCHKTCGLGRKHAKRQGGRFTVTRWRGIDNAAYNRRRSGTDLRYQHHRGVRCRFGDQTEGVARERDARPGRSVSLPAPPSVEAVTRECSPA